MKITKIGLDIVKRFFHAVCCNEQGRLVKAYAQPQQLSGYIYAIYHSRQFLPAKVAVFIDKVQAFWQNNLN